VLGVVQQHEHMAWTQLGDDRVAQRPAAPLGHAQRLGDRGRDQAFLMEWRQIDEDHAVGIVLLYGARHLHGQAGLTHAAGAGQRQQAPIGPLQQRGHGSHVALAPDQ
jgi:hypothetical protein